MSSKMIRHQQDIFEKIYAKTEKYRLESWRDDFIRVLFGFLKPTKEDIYLDVGCGAGYNIIEAAKKGAFAVGADVSPQALKKAKKFSESQVKDTERMPYFVLCDAAHLPFRSGSFTKISSVQVLEHIKEDALAIDELVRVSKAGCTIFLSTINSIKRIPFFLKPLFYIHERRAGHLRGYLHEHLVDKFITKGFRPIDVLYYTHPIKLMQDVLCPIVPNLRWTKSSLWRKITQLDLKLVNVKTGWTFAVIVKKEMI